MGLLGIWRDNTHKAFITVPINKFQFSFLLMEQKPDPFSYLKATLSSYTSFEPLEWTIEWAGFLPP